MDTWHALADEKIRQAMDRGEFRNLRGQGRPQDLRRNPYEPSELRMAHMALEGAGMAPVWIEERKELDRDIEAARGRLAGYLGKNGVEEEFRTAAAELNRRILTYNLKAPSSGFQRSQIDAEFEIRRLKDS